MRTDHVTLVRGKQIAVGALAHEDVEVVEPEVGHHFIELALAVGGTQQLGLLQFGGDHLLRIGQRHDGLALLRREVLHDVLAVVLIQAARHHAALFRRHLQIAWKRSSGGMSSSSCALASASMRASRCAFCSASLELAIIRILVALGLLAVLLVAIGIDLRFVDGALLGIARHTLLAFRHLLYDLRWREFFEHLLGIHAQGGEASEARLDGMVIDLVRVELLIDPLVHAHGGNAIDFARTRTEAQPVQGMQRTLLLVLVGNGRLFFGADQNRRGKAHNQDQQQGEIP